MYIMYYYVYIVYIWAWISTGSSMELWLPWMNSTMLQVTTFAQIEWKKCVPFDTNTDHKKNYIR